MHATRVLLDRQHVCLACGADWRVVHSTAATPSPRQGPAVWERVTGQCAAKCWESDPDAYLAAAGKRAERGWDTGLSPADVSGLR